MDKFHRWHAHLVEELVYTNPAAQETIRAVVHIVYLETSPNQAYALMELAYNLIFSINFVF